MSLWPISYGLYSYGLCRYGLLVMALDRAGRVGLQLGAEEDEAWT